MYNGIMKRHKNGIKTKTSGFKVPPSTYTYIRICIFFIAQVYFFPLQLPLYFKP
jgi:hypothetical protein